MTFKEFIYKNIHEIGDEWKYAAMNRNGTWIFYEQMPKIHSLYARWETSKGLCVDLNQTSVFKLKNFEKDHEKWRDSVIILDEWRRKKTRQLRKRNRMKKDNKGAVRFQALEIS